MEPITAADIIARIAGALGVATDRVNKIVDHAATNFPDTQGRADYIKAQILAAIPTTEGVMNSVNGLIADLAAHSAQIDPDATGGAV